FRTHTWRGCRREPQPDAAPRWVCRRAAAVRRVREGRERAGWTTTSRLQHSCRQEAEDEPAEQHSVDHERQERVLGDVAHEEGDDPDGDDEGDEGGGGGF